jgi:hypothetical protein
MDPSIGTKCTKGLVLTLSLPAEWAIFLHTLDIPGVEGIASLQGRRLEDPDPALEWADRALPKKVLSRLVVR